MPQHDSIDGWFYVNPSTTPVTGSVQFSLHYRWVRLLVHFPSNLMCACVYECVCTGYQNEKVHFRKIQQFPNAHCKLCCPARQVRTGSIWSGEIPCNDFAAYKTVSRFRLAKLSEAVVKWAVIHWIFHYSAVSSVSKHDRHVSTSHRYCVELAGRSIWSGNDVELLLIYSNNMHPKLFGSCWYRSPGSSQASAGASAVFASGPGSRCLVDGETVPWNWAPGTVRLPARTVVNK